VIFVESCRQATRNIQPSIASSSQAKGLLKLVVDWRDGMVDPVFGEIKRPVVVTIEIEMD
jgi:hypothetical protein